MISTLSNPHKTTSYPSLSVFDGTRADRLVFEYFDWDYDVIFTFLGSYLDELKYIDLLIQEGAKSNYKCASVVDFESARRRGLQAKDMLFTLERWFDERRVEKG